MKRAAAKHGAIASAVLVALSLAAWCYLGTKADQAMDKSGVGDFELWQHYSNLSGLAFYAATAFWAISVGFSQLAPQPFRGWALFAFGLGPILGFFLVFFLALSI